MKPFVGLIDHLLHLLQNHECKHHWLVRCFQLSLREFILYNAGRRDMVGLPDFHQMALPVNHVHRSNLQEFNVDHATLKMSLDKIR